MAAQVLVPESRIEPLDDAVGLRRVMARADAAESLDAGYDAAGNLTGVTVDVQVTSFAYDADDRLTHSTSGSVETTYTNDAYGRRTSEVTSGGSTSYTWDAMGHLTSVVSDDATSTYSYGATGMREYASVTQGGTTTWTKSFWLGSTLTAELDSDGTLVPEPGGGVRWAWCRACSLMGRSSAGTRLQCKGMGHRSMVA